jgi:hypothetical protein
VRPGLDRASLGSSQLQSKVKFLNRANGGYPIIFLFRKLKDGLLCCWGRES